jgi:hypothetical protein
MEVCLKAYKSWNIGHVADDIFCPYLFTEIYAAHVEEG